MAKDRIKRTSWFVPESLQLPGDAQRNEDDYKLEKKLGEQTFWFCSSSVRVLVVEMASDLKTVGAVLPARLIAASFSSLSPLSLELRYLFPRSILLTKLCRSQAVAL